MFPQVLTATQLAVLDGLKPIPEVAEFYLAGGTALALRHGHRRSIDFDFFRPTAFDVQELASALQSVFPDLERLPTGRQTLYVRLSQVTTSFFRFADAEREPVPDMLVPFDWEEAKRYFTAEAARLLAAETS